jgi:hypothetical protein
MKAGIIQYQTNRPFIIVVHILRISSDFLFYIKTGLILLEYRQFN